jgi:hypothetical protein
VNGFRSLTKKSIILFESVNVPVQKKALLTGVYMQITSVHQFIPVLQTAVGPIILISGIGMIILSMSNRLGRVVDRSRILAEKLPMANDADRAALATQLRIAWARGRIIRMSLALVIMSALFAALLILVLFFSALWEFHDVWLIGGLFVICMVCLSGSLILYLHDINRSLVALKMELKLDSIEDA